MHTYLLTACGLKSLEHGGMADAAAARLLSVDDTHRQFSGRLPDCSCFSPHVMLSSTLSSNPSFCRSSKHPIVGLMSHCQLYGHQALPSHVRGSAFAVASFLCPSLPSSTCNLPSFISAQASSLCVSKAYPIPVLSSGLILRAIYKEVRAAEGFERTLIHLPTYPYTLTSRLADSRTLFLAPCHPLTGLALL